MKKPVPYLRGDSYYIRRRVPTRYKPVEPHTFVHICLNTDSPAQAETKAKIVWAEMVEAWEAKLEGNQDAGAARMAAARRLAARRGYAFMPAADVATLPIEDLLQRVESVVDRRGRLDMVEADAALGLPPAPTIPVSDALDKFYEVAADRLIGKSEDQIRRHKAPRLKATNNFIAAVADKPLHEITTQDLFKFRQWWLARIKAGEVTPETANKDITYLAAMWKAVAQANTITLNYSTAGVRFVVEDDRDNTRPPFSVEWIRTKILKPGALDGLNTDARIIVLGMVNTGYRPSEGAGLPPSAVNLEGAVPFISIAPTETRKLKNANSKRTIPLTGISLDAFREKPGGFDRYADSSATLSATINKFMRENGLLETPEHTMYSLRHAFEDRMLEAGIDERIRKDLLGHTLDRERYGEGGRLSFIHGLLQRIAL